jgi:hypothetical protein
MSGLVGVTFLLYCEQEGGAPLWMETQNVQPDKTGRYTVTLGLTSSRGLPTDICVAGEARWLGVQAEGLPEQPRVMLLSVPHALKAGDAETLGGLPASAFVLATPPAATQLHPIRRVGIRRRPPQQLRRHQVPTVTTTGGHCECDSPLYYCHHPSSSHNMQLPRLLLSCAATSRGDLLPCARTVAVGAV